MTEIEREHVTGAVRELREYARGQMSVDHSDVHRHTGLIRDAETRDNLSFFAEAYQPTDYEIRQGMPRDFWGVPMAQRALRKNGTNVATQAIREANASQAAYLTGLPGYKSDVSGMHALQQMAEWLTIEEQCKLIYIAALMGRGKTDLCCLMGEVIADHYRRVSRSVDDDIDVPTPEFAANFHVDTKDNDPDVLQINHHKKLIEWMKEGNSSQERWFFFDEASSELTAQSPGNAMKVVQRLGSLIKKMRKMGVNLVVIGHDKGDVHVLIRALADFVDKPSLKTAKVYQGITNRQPVGLKFEASGIPPTAWQFDTDDTADWCWCDDSADSECPYHVDSDETDDGLTEDDYKELLTRRAVHLWQNTDMTQAAAAEALSTEPDDKIQIKITQTDVSRCKGSMEAKGLI